MSRRLIHRLFLLVAVVVAVATTLVPLHVALEHDGHEDHGARDGSPAHEDEHHSDYDHDLVAMRRPSAVAVTLDCDWHVPRPRNYRSCKPTPYVESAQETLLV